MATAIEIGLEIQQERITRERRLRELRGGMTLGEVIQKANNIPWPYERTRRVKLIIRRKRQT